MTATTPTVRELVLGIEARFRAAGLHYGHGTDNPRDEAVWLVFHLLGLPYDCPEAALEEPVPAAARERIEALAAERIASRRPLAYLLGEAWFAGLPFRVDERVLIPRSPFAELIREGFAPWLEPASIRRVLEIGTGSGCMAVATAHYLPQAEVVATDIDEGALALAEENARRHGVAGRVRLARADVYEGLDEPPFDLIISNPPYVPQASMETLPPEYRHEPAAALAAGTQGLDVVDRLLAGASRFLRPGGTLIVEVGEAQPFVEANYPRLPLTWLEFAHGGEGVFLIGREALAGAALHLPQGPSMIGTV
ncbi:MAG: 50S ribosomal protein L3 N(5)-glutamine methyltransferase [Gammaproteobacteria bacterium]|nr:MAG: 50S ribosomal protein L3 N(5)-glutamine methyltransferase [Gammaproteobacteria bacterium]